MKKWGWICTIASFFLFSFALGSAGITLGIMNIIKGDKASGIWMCVLCGIAMHLHLALALMLTHMRY